MSLNVLMVFPRFNENSFWSLRAACKIYGAQCPTPPLGLLTLAALLPQDWTMRLVDRNVRTLKPADLDRLFDQRLFDAGTFAKYIDRANPCTRSSDRICVKYHACRTGDVAAGDLFDK